MSARSSFGAVAAAWAAAVVWVLVAGPALAQGTGDDRYGTAPAGGGYGDDGSGFSLKTGLGFTAGPSNFLLAFEGDYAFTQNVSTGLHLDLAFDDDRTVVSPFVYGRFRTDLSFVDEALEQIEPYGQFGLGFTYWDVDRPAPRSGTTSDTELLLNFGVGVEYRFLENVSVGTEMGFNVIPVEVFDERFYFSWQVVGLRYRF